MGTFQGDRSSSPQVPSVLIMKASGFLGLIFSRYLFKCSANVFEGSRFFQPIFNILPVFSRLNLDLSVLCPGFVVGFDLIFLSMQNLECLSLVKNEGTPHAISGCLRFT